MVYIHSTDTYYLPETKQVGLLAPCTAKQPCQPVKACSANHCIALQFRFKPFPTFTAEHVTLAP